VRVLGVVQIVEQESVRVATFKRKTKQNNRDRASLEFQVPHQKVRERRAPLTVLSNRFVNLFFLMVRSLHHLFSKRTILI
jgi:hypothetical protein